MGYEWPPPPPAVPDRRPMQKRRLGRTDLDVSVICLGTMTWGHQNTEAEGHAQMDLAMDRGVTFWDTAEMYAVPPTRESYGTTETIIGNWFAGRKRRHEVVLASKVCGRTTNDWVRGGAHRLDRANIVAAVEASLTRLRTDWIDLYQLHWPDRPTPRFGAIGWGGAVPADAVPFEETAAVMGELVKAGKIRHWGLSNETAWGTMRMVQAAAAVGAPPPASIQNAYNLLNRTFETDLAEACLNEGVSLLPYAPIAAGTLTGKYLDGKVPPGTRRALDFRRSRYDKPGADAAVRAYLAIADRHGIPINRLAVAFTLTRPFVPSTIIGATTLEQLESNIAGAETALSDEVLREIDAVHVAMPNPCP